MSPRSLIVEVEVALELGGRRLTRVAAIAPLLILGQEVVRHPIPLPESPIRLGARCRIGSPSPRHRQTLEIIGFPGPIPRGKMGRLASLTDHLTPHEGRPYNQDKRHNRSKNNINGIIG